jgi:transcriptional regulator with XRE-family HTH domain
VREHPGVPQQQDFMMPKHDDTEAKRIGAILATLRQNAKMTLREVAERSGFTTSHVWALEHGHGSDVTIRAVRAMAACYGVPLATFFTEDDLGSKLHPEAMRVALVVDEAFRKAGR